ncbi:MAG: DNA-protecting protein DprA [Fusicatenibacter sp.]|nr:DNA-protecting protein DprA [Fusicatenibacter sp.]
MTEDAPIVLYYKGHFEYMKDPVAIVGARRCTQEAKFRAVELAEQYTRNGQTIISGMAKGIDSYAHTACLNAEGYTVAIVGNGLDICYPSEHKKLMDCIIEKGLMISEYPPGIKPSRYTFPRRNRLISAWAEHIVVIAPGKGSGALITAEYGRKYGRQVEIIGQLGSDTLAT